MGPSPTSPGAFAPLPAFELRASRGLLGGTLLLHAAAAAPALLLPSLEPAWRLIWLVGVLLELLVTLYHHLPPLPRAIVRLGREGAGAWRLEDGGGRQWQGEPTDFIAHPWLCVLRIGRGWRGRTVVIPADACSPAQHRRLRVALREHGGPPPGAR